MKSKRSLLKSIGLFVVLVILGFSLLFLKAQFTFSNIHVSENNNSDGEKPSLFSKLPEDDPNLRTVLLLGIRGEESPYGGLLTDSIILASLNKQTKEVSIVSIPRDLYVRLPGSTKKEKINYVYAYGLEKGGISKGINYSERVVSRVTGVHIDDSVVVEMEALKKVVKTLGGIDVHLDDTFVEDKQWFCNSQGEDCWRFELPAGDNHLNATETIYYIRSRFSSNDFDRARRQQQVLFAIKDRVFSLNILSRPDRILELFGIVDENIRTSMDQKEIISFARNFRSESWHLDNIQNHVLRAGPEQPLEEATIEEGRYVLLPKEDDWSEVQKIIGKIIED